MFTGISRVINRRIQLVIIAVILMNSVLKAETPLDLSLRLNKGESFICAIDMTRDVTQTIEGKEQRLNQALRTYWQYDVIEEYDNGDYGLQMTFTRVSVKQDFGFQSSEYDSDDPPSYIEPSMRGYGAMVGARLSVRLNPGGEVIELAGVDSLLEEMILDIDLPDSPQKDRMISGIREQFGTEAMKSAIGQLTAFYPSQPVTAGDSWENEESVFSGFPMKVADRYTLLSRLDGTSQVEVNSIITAAPDDAGIEMGDIDIFYDIVGSQSGVIEVNEISGLPLRSDIDMEFEGTVRASGVPDQPERSWPIKAVGRVLVTIEKI
jgi:hypothetical protein